MAILDLMSSVPAHAAEADMFVSGGAADIEWGHWALAVGARLNVNRWFLEPSLLDVRSDRPGDVHRGLALQAGIASRRRPRSIYAGVGAKLGGTDLMWLSAGLRWIVGRTFVITPEFRFGVFGSESARSYAQASVSLGASFAVGTH